MKKTTAALLGIGYLALGLSLSGATTGEISAATTEFPNLTYPTITLHELDEELCAGDSAELACFLAARDTNEVRIEIEGVDPEAGLMEAITEIVKISTAEAAKLSAQIAEIQALVEAGTITDEEGERRVEELTEDFEQRMENVGESMEEWGEEFGQRMEAWGEEFGKKWESKDKELEAVIEKDLEKGLKLDFDLDTEEQEDEEEAPKKSSKVKFTDLELHFGANSLRDASGMATATENYLSGWESLNSRVFVGTKRKIFGPASPLLLQTGIGFEGIILGFTEENTIVKVPGAGNDDATTEIAGVTGLSNVRRNRWEQAYIEVPAMLMLDFSPRGKVNKSISVGFGGYGGIRLDSKAFVLGNDAEGERTMIQTTSNFNTHLLRYGLQAQVGYKAFKVTGRLDARPLFQEGAFNEEVYIGSLSLGIAL